MAFVKYHTPLKRDGKISETISAERAAWILEQLNSPSPDLTESQKAYLEHVERVYTAKPGKQTPVMQKEQLNSLGGHSGFSDTYQPEDKLLNKGIEQGVAQGLPVHDR